MAIWIIFSGLVLLIVCLTFILRNLYLKVLSLQALCASLTSAFLISSKAVKSLDDFTILLKQKFEIADERARVESERTTYLERDLGDFQASVYEAIKIMTDRISGGSLKSKSLTSVSPKKNDKKPD